METHIIENIENFRTEFSQMVNSVMEFNNKYDLSAVSVADSPETVEQSRAQAYQDLSEKYGPFLSENGLSFELVDEPLSVLLAGGVKWTSEVLVINLVDREKFLAFINSLPDEEGMGEDRQSLRKLMGMFSNQIFSQYNLAEVDDRVIELISSLDNFLKILVTKAEKIPYGSGLTFCDEFNNLSFYEHAAEGGYIRECVEAQKIGILRKPMTFEEAGYSSRFEYIRRFYRANWCNEKYFKEEWDKILDFLSRLHQNEKAKGFYVLVKRQVEQILHDTRFDLEHNWIDGKNIKPGEQIRTAHELMHRSSFLELVDQIEKRLEEF